MQKEFNFDSLSDYYRYSSLTPQIKEFPSQENAKGAHHHQTSMTRNVKGSSLRRKEKNTNNKMAVHIYQQSL